MISRERMFSETLRSVIDVTCSLCASKSLLRRVMQSCPSHVYLGHMGETATTEVEGNWSRPLWTADIEGDREMCNIVKREDTTKEGHRQDQLLSLKAEGKSRL